MEENPEPKKPEENNSQEQNTQPERESLKPETSHHKESVQSKKAAPSKPKKSISELYNQHYKLLIIIPSVLLIICLVFLFNFNAQNGDIIKGDVTITGGTTITVTNPNTDLQDLRNSLESEFPDLHIRAVSDFRTGAQTGFILQTQTEVEQIQPALEEYLGFPLTQENSSIEFSGNALSQEFYKQLRRAIILAFLFMAIVVFLIFRTAVPSLAVIVAAFSDIVMTLAVVDYFGMTLSTAGIIAFLMIIGYSVDTDILLTTRVIKRKEGSINERLGGALKTGFTMTLTSIAAVAVALTIIYNSSEVLRQIFTILLIGLSFDLFNTWLFNASIVKWYAEAKEGIK